MLLHQLRYAITCAIAGRNSTFGKFDALSRKDPAGIRAEPLVSLENVGVLRNGRWLVRGVDFSVSRGEIVTLIGPNGSGKSTSAKAAIGVLKPDEGRVERKAGLKVGYVPQKLTIDWTLPLSVRRLMTLTGPLPERDMLSALESAGIAHMLDAEVQHLSGGEFQRALMARAIARKPDLLVLDEPVQGVDFSGRSPSTTSSSRSAMRRAAASC